MIHRRKVSDLDFLLNMIGENIQLSPTQIEDVKTKYKIVTNCIEQSSAFYGNDIDMYSQGSYRIGTTNKPIARDEYDLDFVLQIDEHRKPTEQDFAIINDLFDAINNCPAIDGKVELKTRCVRITYKSQFHMDIVPAFKKSTLAEDTSIWIPDRNQKDWLPSNPIGYSTWFENQCKKMIVEKTAVFESASVEKLPDDIPFTDKPVLKRAVQLVKRLRDVYFQDKAGKLLPKSIILTTLFAENYIGLQSTYDVLQGSINYILGRIAEYNGNPFEVINKSNDNENLADSLVDSEVFTSFKNFVNYANKQLIVLSQASGTERRDLLKSLFGEVALTAINEKANYDIRKQQSEKSRIIPEVIIPSTQKPYGI